MKIVVIASPYAGDVEDNLEYLNGCIFDSLMRDECPYASHALYPPVLDDNIPEQRERGMRAGYEQIRRADLLAVYMDRGISKGMREEINFAQKWRIPVEQRWLSRWKATAGSDASKPPPPHED